MLQLESQWTHRSLNLWIGYCREAAWSYGILRSNENTWATMHQGRSQLPGHRPARHVWLTSTYSDQVEKMMDD